MHTRNPSATLAALLLGLASGVAARAQSQPWSFEPLRPVTPPALRDTWVRNPIDAFILAELREHGLEPAPPADQQTLIRRLGLVLHGLPPTPEEVEAFRADKRTRGSEEAFERLVSRALASPRYGERWARHWLDVVRFGETHGFETNRERPTAWRYRDYVIDAFNADTSYDRFVKEQIAGDALGADVGTGFLVAGPYDLVKSPDVNLTLMQRQDELADIVHTTGTAFLGLTLGCARCHDHRFDPVTQEDYYSVQAVFAGVHHGERELAHPPERRDELAHLRERTVELRHKLARFVPGADPHPLREAVDARHNVERFPPRPARFVRFSITATNTGEPCIDELEVWSGSTNVAAARAGARATCSSSLPGYDIHKLEHIHDGRHGNGRSWISNEPGGGWVQIELAGPQTIDRITWSRDREGHYTDRLATEYRIDVALAPNEWATVASSDDREPYSKKDRETVYRFDDAPAEEAAAGRRWLATLRDLEERLATLSQPPKAYIGRFAQPGAVHVLYRGEPTAKRDEVAPDTVGSLGHLELSTTTAESTRRVRFAEWLASARNPLTPRVIVNRLWQHHFGAGIVETPSDFGSSGAPPTHPRLLDWLAGELVRSGWSIKHVQRLILLSSTFRQSSRPRAAALEVDAESRLLWRFPPRRLEAEAIRDSVLRASGALDLAMGGPGFSAFEVELENVRHYFPKTSFAPDDWRRMVYMTKVRQEQDAVFGAFDCPDASQEMPRRSRSTTPLQALNLFNSAFMIQQAAIFARRLEHEAATETSSRVRLGFRLAFGRAPSAEELEAAVSFVRDHGLEAFCRALFNANEFVFMP